MNKITMFVQTVASQSQAPGVVSKSVRLVAIPGAQGPNGAIFVGGNGSGFLELQNVTDEIAAQYSAGATIEITPAEPAP